MTRTLAAVLLVLLPGATSLRGDTLSELRTTLASLRGTKPIEATIDLQRTRKSSGRFSNSQSQGGATFGVRADASGLSLTISQALLDRAAAETRERQADPKKQMPTRAAIDEIEATNMVEALNFAEPLQRLLRIGAVTGEKRVAFQNRSSRQLTLKLTEPLPPQAASIFNVQFSQDHLNIWIADDGTPLGAERVRKGSAKFLFLRGEMNSRESWHFTRRDDRLVVSRFEASFAGSGFGQKGEGRTVQTVTPK
ncbi:MAG TPA: hypothetical protein VF698_11195 [Thermoanaerobaculia bacterium]